MRWCIGATIVTMSWQSKEETLQGHCALTQPARLAKVTLVKPERSDGISEWNSRYPAARMAEVCPGGVSLALPPGTPQNQKVVAGPAARAMAVVETSCCSPVARSVTTTRTCGG